MWRDMDEMELRREMGRIKGWPMMRLEFSWGGGGGKRGGNTSSQYL